jgi:hypothetical protein
MNDLATAREQLEQAITRLETALSTRGNAADMEKALVEARAETERLRAAANTVTGRLDAAIGRLQTALEPGAEH